MRNKRKPNSKLEGYYKAQGSCCYYCKNKIAFNCITRDHILPRSKGGTFGNNSVFACVKCNTLKGAKTLEEFRSAILRRLLDMIRKIVASKFKASQSEIDKFRNTHRILMGVVGLINNDGKPIFN